MKKKISLVLCLCFTVLALTACGTDPATVDYYGTSYSDLQAQSESVVTTLVGMSDEDMEYYKTYSESEATVKLVTGWQEAIVDLGSYQGIGELSIDKANGTVTVDQYVEFQNREVDITFVYEYDYGTEALGLTDITVDKVYTLGEKLSKAGLNTLMGMGTVFAVLILISLIIYCFRFIGAIGNGKKKQEETKAAPVQAAAPVAQEPTVLTDDLELVAVISAAIAASTGTSTDSFVVRSIHRR